MAIKALSASQFATAFRLRPQQLAWLLGSGASASAGIPTGYAMITDFKKILYCQLSGTKLREVDVNDPLWISRIDAFFATRAILPPPNDPAEYAEAFEAVYTTPEARRNYIEDAIRRGTPSLAHRVLASLITSKRTHCVFTTNFDDLVEFATTVTDHLMPAVDRAHLTVAALDNPDRAERCLRDSAWPLLAKLHGDFQSVDLKNTSSELRTQDAQMRSVLTGACERFGLAIVGYSGRDASVMEALTDALSRPNAYPGGIYWVSRSANSLLPAVTSFLESAVAAGVNAVVVESQAFDELAADMVDGLSLPDVLMGHIFATGRDEVVRPVPLPSVEVRKFPVLQCSALPIVTMPKFARHLRVNTAITSERARELLKEANIWAVVSCNGREIAAFGRDEELLRAFESVGATIAGTVELDPSRESWAVGLIYDALIRATCRNRPLRGRLRRHGHSVVVAKSRPDDTEENAARRHVQLRSLREAYPGSLVGTVPEIGFPFSEGVQLRLEETVAGRWWWAFEPMTYVELPRREKPTLDDDEGSSFAPIRPGDLVADWRRERWANRYNKVWAKIIAAWAGLLVGEEGGVLRAFGLSDGVGIDAVFELLPITAWSRPAHQHDYFLRR